MQPQAKPKGTLMNDQLSELKDRISQMSDGELRRIVEVEYDDYRKEAIEFAQAELAKRFVPFNAPDPAQVESTEDESAELASIDEPCLNCEGPMRSGLLFSDKELTILFSDNNEERFVQALACAHCGEVRLVVDFKTDVEG